MSLGGAADEEKMLGLRNPAVAVAVEADTEKPDDLRLWAPGFARHGRRSPRSTQRGTNRGPIVRRFGHGLPADFAAWRGLESVTVPPMMGVSTSRSGGIGR